MNAVVTRQEDGVVSVTLAARAINPLSRLFQRELATLLAQLELRRGQLAAVIIGFDAAPAPSQHELAHLLALTPAQAADCMQMLASYNALLQRLEHMGVPVAAVLDGDIRGHALGLALACHYRVGLAAARLSLPQVRLGLTPVAGEIVRTVRLAGLRAAMPLLLDGLALSAEQARQAGWLHAVAADQRQLAGLAAALRQQAASQPWHARQHRLPGGGPESAAGRALLLGTLARLPAPAHPGASAATAILCAMAEGAQVSFEHALLIESRYFCQTAIARAALASL